MPGRQLQVLPVATDRRDPHGVRVEAAAGPCSATDAAQQAVAADGAFAPPLNGAALGKR
jgi:predicted NAD/FAD-binding protein